MKKLLLGILAVITTVSLVACGQQETTTITPGQRLPETTPVVMQAPEEELGEEPEVEVEEQVGIGNTDEGMVVLALEKHLKDAFSGEIEEVNPTNIKVYTEEEIADSEALKDYTLNEGDIVFEADYELKIAEGVEDMNKFTAATGEIDGQWIRNKHNVGIARNNGEAGYSIDAFGTAF